MCQHKVDSTLVIKSSTVATNNGFNAVQKWTQSIQKKTTKYLKNRCLLPGPVTRLLAWGPAQWGKCRAAYPCPTMSSEGFFNPALPETTIPWVASKGHQRWWSSLRLGAWSSRLSLYVVSNAMSYFMTSTLETTSWATTLITTMNGWNC
jgi:hypothetical protein